MQFEDNWRFLVKECKKYKKTSMEKDVKNALDIVCCRFLEHGIVCDEKDFIYEKKHLSRSIKFYKRRVPISSLGLSKSNGGRLIYGIIDDQKIYPFLFFLAADEGKNYEISGKNYPLTSSNFARIIDCKLKE